MRPKVPILIIKNSAGSLILDKRGIPVGRYMTKFAYEFDETGEDDKATITLSLTREQMDVIDNRYLGVDQTIFIQWGYGGDKEDLSQTRKVAIRDYESKYSNKSIQHTLKCSDLISYLKTTQGVSSAEKVTSFAEYLGNLAKGRFKIISEIDLAPIVGTDYGFLDVHDQASLDLIPRTHFLPDDTQYALTYLRKYSVIYPEGKSDYHNIKDSVESAEGNYTVNGRDDKLYVKKDVKPNKKVVRNYIIEQQLGDTVLAFMPESKFKNNDVDLNQDVTVDPETGEITVKGGSVIINDKALEAINVTESKKLVLPTDQIERQTVPYIKHVTSDNFDQNDVDDRDVAIAIENEFLETVAEAVNRSKPGNIHILGNGNDNYIANTVIAKPIPVSVLIQSPRLKPELQHLAQNDLAKKEYKKRKMVLKVIGDPGIKSDSAVWISGAARKHNGKYYIQKVTHTISSSGFTTSMEGVKVNLSSAGLKTLIKNLDGVQTLDEDEYYKLLEEYIPEKDDTFLEVDANVEYGDKGFRQGTPGYVEQLPSTDYEDIPPDVDLPISVDEDPNSIQGASYETKSPEDS